MGKTKLEEAVERMIVLKEITSPSGSLSDRTKREYEKVGKEVCERLKERQTLPENSNLIANLAWSDKAAAWARKITLGIKEFKQEYPEHGKILEEIIQKHRDVRRAKIEFGTREGPLPEEMYIEIIRECGVDDYNKAKRLYRALVKDDPLETREPKYEFLVPE